MSTRKLFTRRTHTKNIVGLLPYDSQLTCGNKQHVEHEKIANSYGTGTEVFITEVQFLSYKTVIRVIMMLQQGTIPVHPGTISKLTIKYNQ